jgi:hypothetical protein
MLVVVAAGRYIESPRVAACCVAAAAAALDSAVVVERGRVVRAPGTVRGANTAH